MPTSIYEAAFRALWQEGSHDKKTNSPPKRPWDAWYMSGYNLNYFDYMHPASLEVNDFEGAAFCLGKDVAGTMG